VSEKKVRVWLFVGPFLVVGSFLVLRPLLAAV
jgi:hypothetical protein